jgi:hypothetical protein
MDVFNAHPLCGLKRPEREIRETLERGRLETAFRLTTYRVETPSENFDLRIGSSHAGFARFLEASGCDVWGLITACNPGGHIDASLVGNDSRASALQGAIQENGWRFHPTRHFADRGDWPVETGFCVLNAPLGALAILARRFSQAAFVHGGPSACPRLSWTGENGARRV